MIDLRAIQLDVNSEFTVYTAREQLTKIVEIFKALPDRMNALKIAVVDARNLSMEIALESDVIWIDEEEPISTLPEEYRHESLGFVRYNHFVYSGRIIYPVKDIKGKVMGFCGWDKFAEPKYLDSRNQGYKAKYSTLYGMEKLPDYYRDTKPVFVVEGIVCCLYLRMNGFNALALLGSNMNAYIVQILKRFGRRLVIIPDNDAYGNLGEKALRDLAGEKIVNQAKRFLPMANIIQSKIEKDIDDSRKREEGKYEQALLSDLRSMSNPLIQKKCFNQR